MSFTQEFAEIIGLKALGWLVSNENLLPVFLGASGVSEAEVKAQAAEPAFLGAVLDFIMTDDAWVLAFCDAQGLEYTAPMAARAALPGGEQVHWT